MTAIQFRSAEVRLSATARVAERRRMAIVDQAAPGATPMTSSRPSLVTVVLAAAALAFASAAGRAQHAEHGHAHDATTAAILNLKLDGGEKWPTDASLRIGMAEIRAAFEADHPAIHAGKETDAQYDALAGRIEAQVNAIVANCKLPPAADANLHYLVADLLQGVGLMRGQDPQRTRHDGAALVHGALSAYGQYFDDPNWQP
jgi:hypothetical protein